MEVLVAALVVGALGVFLLLAVPGAMREATLLRAETGALAQLIKSPAPPTFVRRGQVPDALKPQLSRFLLQVGFLAGCVG
jgi:hypothetical protein